MYCPVTVTRVTYYVRYELKWNHCATKQPQPLQSLLKKYQMDYKDESKASQKELQPSTACKGRARNELGHHTCTESQLFF